jgi:hypothetical protein
LGFPTLGIWQVEIGRTSSTRRVLRNVYTILVKSQKLEVYVEDLVVGGRIIL